MSKTREQRERYEQHSFDAQGNIQAPRRLYTSDDITRLQEALESFISLPELRRCVAEQRDVYEALRVDKPPKELEAIMRVLAAVLEPRERIQVRAPADVAGMLMLTLGQKDQEELWTVLLDTKNRLLGTHCVYRGSLNASLITNVANRCGLDTI